MTPARMPSVRIDFDGNISKFLSLKCESMLLHNHQEHSGPHLQINSLAVPVTRNDTGGYCLQQSRHLPRSRPSFRMTQQTLLCHDRHSVAWRAGDRSEYVVPDASLVLLLRAW